MLNFLLIILCLWSSLIESSPVSNSESDTFSRSKENFSLNLSRDPRVVSAFDSVRDLSSFLIHAERFNNTPDLESLIDSLEPSHHSHLNSHILIVIVNFKGAESALLDRFLVKCLQQSPFQASVWYNYCQLRSLNRFDFSEKVKELCHSAEIDYFSTYLLFELVSVLSSCLVAFLPPLVLLLFDQAALYLLIWIVIYYFSYQNFASII